MKSPLVILGLFAASLVMGVVLAWPQYKEFSETNGQLQVRKNELETLQAYQEKLRSLDAQLAEYEKEVAIVDGALPDDPSLPALYDLFQDITATSGLVLNNLSISANPSVSAFSPKAYVFSASLGVKGTYEAFKGFLESLKNSWRILDPESVNFSSEAGGIFDFSVQVSVFSY